MVKRILYLALVMTASIARAAIVIDDFSLGQAPLVAGPVGTTVSSTVGPSASIFGGYRSLQITKTPGPGVPGDVVTADVIGGSFSLVVAGQASGEAVLRWDGGMVFGPGGVDFALCNGFTMDVDSVAGNGSASIQVTDVDGWVSSFTTLLSALSPPQTYTVPFASFAGSADFTRISTVQLRFTGGLTVSALVGDQVLANAVDFRSNGLDAAFLVKMDRFAVTSIPTSGSSALLALACGLLVLPWRRTIRCADRRGAALR